MALVLGATGLFLYLRFSADLDSAINDGLRSRAADVVALSKEADSGLSEGRHGFGASTESFAEIVDARGRVLDSAPQVGGHLLLSRSELRTARHQTIFLNRGPLPGLHDQSRLMATPARAHGRPVVIIVGTSTETRTTALGNLLRLLLIGGPIALLLAALAGYGVAAAALRPVEEMRSRAAEISTAEPRQLLPVSPAQDEVARLGTTLNEMLARIGAAMEHERGFIADASHELRTPLAVLRAEIELALREGRSREELQAALASAAEETDRVIQLAEDLLVIAQTDQGRLALRPSELSVGELLADVRHRFAGRAAEAGRELTVSAEPSLTTVADRLRLEQALGNMVDNALRYGRGQVELTAERSDGVLELHVLDGGPGFPPGFVSQAFERFSRRDGKRDRSGAGLGLSIVESIARSHDGTARVSNRRVGGADVSIAIPQH
jgi:two-component system OmpR family sensor kinase